MSKKILFIFCGVFFFTGVNGQDQNIVDSLYSVLKDKVGGERFGPLYELAFQYIHKDNTKALEILEQSEVAALMSADTFLIVKSKRVKGQILYLLERTQEARNIFDDILPVAVRNNFDKERLYILNALGSLNLYGGQYDKALTLGFKLLDLAKKFGDKEFTAVALHSIGMAYYKLTDYKKGLEYLEQAYQLHEVIQFATPKILANMGLCYAYLRDFSSARKLVERSLRECGPACSAKSRINIEHAFGLISRGEERLKDAEEHFLKSYSLARSSNDTRFQLDNIYLLTEIYMKRKHFKEAEVYLLEAEKLMNSNAHFKLEMIKIYSRFSELYRKIHDYRRASHYQYKYAELKDSVYNEELTNSLMKAEAEFLERENKAKIESQAEVILLKDRVIKHQWFLNVVMGLLGLISIAFVIFIFRNYRKKRDLNIMLDQKVKERTLELELNRNELLRTLKERDLMIRQASDGIFETLHTIEGLCYTGIRELSDPVAHSYLGKIDKTICRLGDYLRPVYDDEILISS